MKEKLVVFRNKTFLLSVGINEYTLLYVNETRVSWILVKTPYSFYNINLGDDIWLRHCNEGSHNELYKVFKDINSHRELYKTFFKKQILKDLL